jgi:hypothetical protein
VYNKPNYNYFSESCYPLIKYISLIFCLSLLYRTEGARLLTSALDRYQIATGSHPSTTRNPRKFSPSPPRYRRTVYIYIYIHTPSSYLFYYFTVWRQVGGVYYVRIDGRITTGWEVEKKTGRWRKRDVKKHKHSAKKEDERRELETACCV